MLVDFGSVNVEVDILRVGYEVLRFWDYDGLGELSNEDRGYVSLFRLAVRVMLRVYGVCLC